MIKHYVEYKRKKLDEMLSSPLVSPEEKSRLLVEFKSLFKDGCLVLTKSNSQEMLRLVLSSEIPFVMDESDCAIIIGTDMVISKNDGHPFKKMSDLVAIHKTLIPPKKDMILTRESNGGENKIYFVHPETKEKHTISYIAGSDTIHFTLNCPVENHESGNDWDSYKYAVMIVLDKLDKDKILDVKSEDTYLDGDVELGSDYILFCPLGERDAIKEENPNATIIEYDGISLNDAISAMIIFSGRKLEPYGPYGWGKWSEWRSEHPDCLELDKIVAESDYPNLTGQFGRLLHSESKYMARRMWKREYEALIALTEYVRDNNIDLPDEVVVSLLKYNGAYATPGLLTSRVSDFKEFVVPILEKHGYHVGDEFFEGIPSNAEGNKYISHFPDPNFGGMMVPSVQCPEWENVLRERTIALIKGYGYKDDNNKVK